MFLQQKKIAALPVDKFTALFIHEKATNVAEVIHTKLSSKNIYFKHQPFFK